MEGILLAFGVDVVALIAYKLWSGMIDQLAVSQVLTDLQLDSQIETRFSDTLLKLQIVCNVMLLLEGGKKKKEGRSAPRVIFRRLFRSLQLVRGPIYFSSAVAAFFGFKF